MIGEMLLDIDDYAEREKWFRKWDPIFKQDNPRYQSEKFKNFVFENFEYGAERF